MKRIIPFFAFFALTISVFAQSPITIEPSTIQIVRTNADLSNEFLDIDEKYTVTNISDETVNLIWYREVSPDCNAEWETAVCDNNNCYFSSISTNDPNVNPTIAAATLAPGEASDIFAFHVQPKGVAGCCTASLTYYLDTDLNNPVGVAEFQISINEPNCFVSVEEEIASSIKVFPNPVTNYFQLEGNDENVVKELVVYNLIGRQVRTFDAVNQSQYDMSGLPQGIYLVGMFGENGEILRTVRMSRQFVTP